MGLFTGHFPGKNLMDLDETFEVTDIYKFEFGGDGPIMMCTSGSVVLFHPTFPHGVKFSQAVAAL